MDYEKLRKQSANLSAYGLTIAGLCQEDYDKAEELRKEHDKLVKHFNEVKQVINKQR